MRSPEALDVSLLWYQPLEDLPAEDDMVPLVSALDGADPKGLEPIPEVHLSKLDAVSGPGPGDGLQGLDFVVPGG